MPHVGIPLEIKKPTVVPSDSDTADSNEYDFSDLTDEEVEESISDLLGAP